MAAGFKIRRVKSENSIGDKLKRARIRKKITVAEVEEQTKIRAKFILALESDSWEQIPSEVYGRGYLERYLDFLHIQKESVMKQFDRERGMYARHCQEGQVELAPKPRLYIPRFLITPRFVFGVFGLAAIAGFIVVVTSQINQFAASPFVEILSPEAVKAGENSELVSSTDSLTVSGRTSVGATVSVNGRSVEVNGDGRFSGTVQINKGQNVITIEAINSKGKKTTEIHSVMVK